MKLKRILSLLIVMAMVLSSMGTVAFADVVNTTPVSVATEAELKEQLALNTAEIVLANNITITSAITTSGVSSTIDLKGNTLTIGAGDNKFNDATTLTIKNGIIDITGVQVKSNAVFCLDEYEKTLVTTLNLENVDVTGNGYSSAYGVFYVGSSSILNVTGGEWTLSDDTHASGGVFKADDSNATLNIKDTEMTLTNVRRVVTYADTTIENSEMTISGDANEIDAEMEHGFNRSPLTIIDSTISMTNMVGRGITAQNGAVEIKGTSTVTMENVQEATIDVRNNQTVTVEETATVTLDKEPTVADGCTISGVVTIGCPIAKIGVVEYTSLEDALNAASSMTGNVTIEILDKVTLNKNLSGNYDSITFVGTTDTAEIYLDVQGYITATGKNVAFTDLTLSKFEGGYITNAGFMNVAFGIYDVLKVTYTNCTFTNGAYASSGVNTFTKCTFYRSYDKYGLWAYGDAEVIVDNCVFADYRGIKMYAEGKAKTTELTVTNTDFSQVTDKPAIVLTYGESVELEGNTYSSTGTFELDLDGDPNGTPVTSDVSPVCVNDNGACGVLVDGKIYTTVAQAKEVATEGSTVTLLHNSAETVELAEGVTLNKNGFEAAGITVKVSAPYGTLTNVYTSGNTYWGECGGNAKESFEFKFYNDDTYMGYTSLNNVGGIIDGDVYVSWSIKLDAESNTDEYWDMAWSIQPTVSMQPNRVEQWVDGVKVAEAVVEPNWSDSIFPVVALVADDDGKILSFVNNTTGFTLNDAFANGGNIVILKDIILSEPLTVGKDTKVTLDLAGFDITYNSTTQNEAMITNKGNLTINDSVGDGVINYNYTGAADSSYSKGNYTISNSGTLNLNGGKITIANLRAHAKYPVNNNSTSSDAVFIMNGGHLYNYNTAAIRQFCNSTTYKNSVTINGGLVEGYSAIWVQNPGASTVNASLNITGGEVRTTAAAYVNGTSEIKDVSSKIYCSVDGEGGAWSEDSLVSITGGTINENVYFAEQAPKSITVNEEVCNGYVELPAVYVAKIGDKEYQSVADALVDAKAQGLTDVTITLVGETTKESALSLEDAFNLYTKTQFDSVTFNQEDSSKIYYIDGIYTGKRNNGGYFIFDGVNIIVTGQYIFEGNVKLINNSVVKSVAEANCFIYNGTTTVEPGSKLKGVIDDLRGGTLIVDGGRTDGGYNTEADMQDAIMIINWSGDSITLKNGAYYKANSANEIGRITVNAGANFNVYDSKVDAVEYITVTGTLNTDVNSIITTKTINGAGVITIDAADFAGETVQVINADMSGFTGTVEIINNTKAQYEITDTGIVVSAKAEPVAKVGDTEYTSLQAAINNANGATVTLIANTAETISIVDDATVVIDLGGNILTGYIAPCDPVSLTVKNGSIVNTNGSYSAIEINSGKLTLENTNIESARHGVRIDGAVEAIINGGEYKLNATSGTRHAVNVSGNATLTIKDGTFIGPKGTTMDSGSAVCVQSGATVIIEDGNFSGGKNATLGVSGIMTIYGGTFDQNPSEYLADGYIARGANGEITTDEYIVCVEDFDIKVLMLWDFDKVQAPDADGTMVDCYPVALFGIINTLNYKEVGFILEFEDPDTKEIKTHNFVTNDAYTSLLVNEDVKNQIGASSTTVTPDMYDGTYFYGDMMNMKAKYADSPLRFRPYAKLLDGTYVYGKARYNIDEITDKDDK